MPGCIYTIDVSLFCCFVFPLWFFLEVHSFFFLFFFAPSPTQHYSQKSSWFSVTWHWQWIMWHPHPPRHWSSGGRDAHRLSRRLSSVQTAIGHSVSGAQFCLLATVFKSSVVKWHSVRGWHTVSLSFNDMSALGPRARVGNNLSWTWFRH